MSARRARAAAVCAGALGAATAWAGGCGFSDEGAMDLASSGGLFDASADGAANDGAPDAIQLGEGGVLPEGGDAAALAPTTVVIAAAANIVAPSGNAQQTHLVYAAHSGRWWLFGIDRLDTTALRTFSSTDFVTWVPADGLRLSSTHGADGRNFSVAYADRGGIDVVHIVTSHEITTTDRRLFHARAAITGTKIVFGSPELVSSIIDPPITTVPPDGPATVILGDGHALDLTGWAPTGGSATNTGNANSFLSQSADTGATWTSGFGSRKDIEQEPTTVNNRMGFAVGTNQAVSLWEGAEAYPFPLSVRWGRWASGSWGDQGDVFASSLQQNANDWCATQLANGDIHAVRRTFTTGFEHRVLPVGTNNWDDGNAIPALVNATDTGVVLLGSGQRMVLVTIAADIPNSVMASLWNGTVWSAWTVLEGKTATRTYVSGYADAAGRAAILWSEGSGAGLHVVGRRVLF